MTAISFASISQVRQNAIQPASSELLKSKVSEGLSENPTKTLLCLDTIRYPQVKEQLLTDSVDANFYTLGIWNADNEAMSQMFTVSGSGLSLRGVEVFGSNNATSGSINVRCRIFNVDASNNPIGTALATSTVAVPGSPLPNPPNYYSAMFGTPLVVTNNYAVVVDVTTAGGIFNIFINDIAPGQPYDENLSRMTSSYYPPSNGAYVSIPVLTTDLVNWPNGPYDFEPIVAPLVSYTINTTATASPDPSCLGQAISFSGSATPSGILGNRMYNFNVFESYFMGATSDSTYVWDFDNLSPLVWSNNTSYTYPAAGAYDATMFTLGGFWESCLDFATDPITVNPLPTVTAGASSTTICQGTSTVLSQGNADTYSWNNGIGVAISPTVSPASTTTYTVTGTSAAGCLNTASVTVNVTPLDNATFTYPSNTICATSGNSTPVIVSAGTFSSTAGLNFVNTTTGEINVAGSTPGVYSVTYTTNGTCPDSDIQTISITDIPDASFSYASPSFCTGTSNPNPVFGAGSSAGTFSSTPGLVFTNPSTGEINLATSAAGNYIITNTILANGSCPQVAETFNIAINQAPTATVTGGGIICGDGSVPVAVNVALTGAGPWNVTYSDGTNSTTVNGITSSPYVINASANGTFSVSSVSLGTCSAAGTGSASVVFNPNPLVDISPLNSLCDNEGLTTINATPSGGAFSGSAMSGNQFDPAQNPGVYPVIYSYTDGNGCSGSASIDVEVLEAADVTLNAFNDVCIQDGAITLGGASPSGGDFSGTGVTNDQFDPTVSGEGTFSITYSYLAMNGCTSSASQSIVVNDCAGINEIEGLEVSISPNPATEIVTINLNLTDLTDLTYSVFSEDGKILVNRTLIKSISTTFNTSSLASGVYFVAIESSKGTLVKKLIIQ
jgi:hypothetical protein